MAQPVSPMREASSRRDRTWKETNMLRRIHGLSIARSSCLRNGHSLYLARHDQTQGSRLIAPTLLGKFAPARQSMNPTVLVASEAA